MPSPFKYGHEFIIDDKKLKEAMKTLVKMESVKPRKAKTMKPARENKMKREAQKKYRKRINGNDRAINQTLNRAGRESQVQQRDALNKAGIHERTGKLHNPISQRGGSGNIHAQYIGQNAEHTKYVDQGTDGYGNCPTNSNRIIANNTPNLLLHLPDGVLMIRPWVRTQKKTNYLRNSYDVTKRSVREFFNQKEHEYLKLR